MFSLVLPIALQNLGLAACYLCWLGFLVIGTAGYWLLGRNAWYFQLRAAGVEPARAQTDARAAGQELFPAGTFVQTLKLSAGVWQTWALVGVYFTTFGGFVALTSWLPTYWTSAFSVGVVAAGLLTALYSLTASGMRVVGGVLADSLYEGGKNCSILSLFIMLTGATIMTTALSFELAIPGVLLLAIGMGITNAAVFKIVPQVVPQAVGGAAGWVGGIGAFGGFVIPPMLAFAVRDLGRPGYAIGFIVFVFLALLSLALTWIVKYAKAPAAPALPRPAEARS